MGVKHISVSLSPLHMVVMASFVEVGEMVITVMRMRIQGGGRG